MLEAISSKSLVVGKNNSNENTSKNNMPKINLESKPDQLSFSSNTEKNSKKKSNKTLIIAGTLVTAFIAMAAIIKKQDICKLLGKITGKTSQNIKTKTDSLSQEISAWARVPAKALSNFAKEAAGDGWNF